MKKIKIRHLNTAFVLVALTLLPFQRLFAQTSYIDSIAHRIEAFGVKNQQPFIFAHFDKNVYVQNENVWFTAYLLNRNENYNPDVLSLFLVNDLTKTVVLRQKFLISGGVAFGNVFLTDSIPVGKYSFMMYANQVKNQKPADVFVQPVTIASTAQPTFKVSLMLDTGRNTNGERTARVSTTFPANASPGSINIKYILGNAQHPLLSGNGKIDNDGKYAVAIRESEVEDRVLDVQVKHNKDVQNVKLIIPTKRKQIKVKFFPEGGYLVDGSGGWVGWETQIGNGGALKTKGILYRNNIPVDTIETDSYGMGRFKLTPAARASYYVKLSDNAFKDSVFKLPEVLAKSPVISIKQALVDDTLEIKLTSKSPEYVTAIIHNYRQMFFATPMRINSDGKTIRFSLKDVPKGLTAVTLLNGALKPCAERLFFAHYNQRSLIDIQTDKARYSKREKVKLSLKFKTPDTGFVSVACVQSNRLQIRNGNDIESYSYLKHDLGAFAIKDHYFGNDEPDRNYFENLLLIKGWTRYKWQAMDQDTKPDTLEHDSLLTMGGTVRYLGRSVKKPLQVVVMTDSTTTTVTANANGTFMIDNNTILTQSDKKVHFLVVDKNASDFRIVVSDPFQKIDEGIATRLTARLTDSNAVSSSTDSFVLKGLQHAIALKEVKIRSTKDNSLLNSSKITGTENECGDYVCTYNILNCPNHRGLASNTIPIVGQYYIIKGMTQRYMGCWGSGAVERERIDLMSSIDGIKYGKEFYGSDYSVINPPQPEYFSTIFWKYLVPLNSSRQAQMEFYTSDITGAFKVIVQGITEKDVVYSEKEFVVK